MTLARGRWAALLAALLLSAVLTSPWATARTMQLAAAAPVAPTPTALTPNGSLSAAVTLAAESTLADATARRGAAGTPLRASTVAVSDGDSFVVRGADGARLRVRLAGIDAPERSQPWSSVARRHLGELLGGSELMLSPIKIDPFGRLVARVEVDGVDPALAMLQAGLAWHFARYDRDLPPELRLRYAEAAALARREGLGLWAGDDPEPPWDFRRRRTR